MCVHALLKQNTSWYLQVDSWHWCSSLCHLLHLYSASQENDRLETTIQTTQTLTPNQGHNAPILYLCLQWNWLIGRSECWATRNSIPTKHFEQKTCTDKLNHGLYGGRVLNCMDTLRINDDSNDENPSFVNIF